MSAVTSKFWRDRRGNAGLLFALLSVPVILATGGGVDLIRQERERQRAQAALDAGIVAAASLRQMEAAEQIIPQYFAAAGVKGFSIKVNETRSLNSHTVVATATMAMPTAFLRLARIPTLPVNVSARATEAVKNLELSLVLDLSGSMAKDGRIQSMRPAAKGFIDQLLTPQTKDYTSISVIPYAGQTSVGKEVFNVWKASSSVQKQDYSWCFSNLETTFTTTPDFSTQVPYFGTQNLAAGAGYDYPNTPTDETSISYLSNDATALKAKIDQYHMFDGTGTQIAMKWAYHLLDPDFRTHLTTARNAIPTLYPAAFIDRPKSFTDPNTLKFIVLMTDGEIWDQSRPTDTTKFYFPTAPSTSVKLNRSVQAPKTFSEACTAAKAKGVTIFTIGYDKAVPATTKAQLLSCASAPSKYYEATTADISKVFGDIARTISPLRLTN